ncbi:MAG: class I SAM-dependent methyltransferase [Woeseiaceae bacterium]
MKAEDAWTPTKFVRKKGVLRASRNPSEVGVGSRLISDIVARFYDKSLQAHASGQLVDLGCGKVPLYAAYREYVTDITCVDWSQPTNGPAHLDFECDLGQKLPLNDAAFDTTVLSDVLEHIPEPTVLWSEMARITKPGGKLLLNTPFLYCLHEQPHDYFRYSEHALRRYAGHHGFEIVSLQAIGGTPEILTDIVAKHLQFVPLIGNWSARGLQAFTRWFIGRKWGASISARTAEAFPLGYAMVAVRNGDGSGESEDSDPNQLSDH